MFFVFIADLADLNFGFSQFSPHPEQLLFPVISLTFALARTFDRLENLLDVVFQELVLFFKIFYLGFEFLLAPIVETLVLFLIFLHILTSFDHLFFLEPQVAVSLVYPLYLLSHPCNDVLF